MKRSLLAVAVSLVLTSPAQGADGGLRRFAVVFGASDGGPTRTPLRYATEDARGVARVLRRLGGVAIGDLHLVEEPDAAGLRTAIGKVAAEAGRARSKGERVEVFLYFSGHSDDEGLLLGRSQLPYAQLRRDLDGIPAEVRVAILDSCSSGAFTRAKGGVHRPPFLLDAASRVKGHAFLTSSAADEASQESERLKGSFFTHALLTGLRGGADASNDGVVTLNEAYQFAYRETLARTESTQGGAQHATYDIGLVGSGEVVMTDLRRADAMLAIPAELEGTVFVRNAAGHLVAELRKVRGAEVELGLEEGRYDLRVSLDRNVSSTSVELISSARVVLDPARLAQVPLEVTTARGDATPGVGAASPAGLTAPAAAFPPAPGPSGDRAGPSWASLAPGLFVPQGELRGSFGAQVQASAGIWLLDFLGLEGSVGFYRVQGDATRLIPAVYTDGYGTSYDTVFRTEIIETISVVPVEATLKLALPRRGLRPYLLGGAGLQFVHVARELPESVDSSQGAFEITRRVSVNDVAFGLHWGFGLSVPLGPRLQATIEGRLQLASAELRHGEQDLDGIDLDAVRLTAGVGYAF